MPDNLGIMSRKSLEAEETEAASFSRKPSSANAAPKKSEKLAAPVDSLPPSRTSHLPEVKIKFTPENLPRLKLESLRVPDAAKKLPKIYLKLFFALLLTFPAHWAVAAGKPINNRTALRNEAVRFEALKTLANIRDFSKFSHIPILRQIMLEGIQNPSHVKGSQEVQARLLAYRSLGELMALKPAERLSALQSLQEAERDLAAASLDFLDSEPALKGEVLASFLSAATRDLGPGPEAGRLFDGAEAPRSGTPAVETYKGLRFSDIESLRISREKTPPSGNLPVSGDHSLKPRLPRAAFFLFVGKGGKISYSRELLTASGRKFPTASVRYTLWIERNPKLSADYVVQIHELTMAGGEAKSERQLSLSRRGEILRFRKLAAVDETGAPRYETTRLDAGPNPETSLAWLEAKELFDRTLADAWNVTHHKPLDPAHADPRILDKPGIAKTLLDRGWTRKKFRL